jgi:polyferredoxin
VKSQETTQAEKSETQRWWRLSRLRWVSQAVFLLLFLFLLVQTVYRGSFRDVQEPIRPAYPVKIFLELDPLNAVATALATHEVYRGLLWAVLIIIGTLLLGRFFCGWICPLGTLNHLFGATRRGEPNAAYVKRNHTKPWQRLKYYVLLGLLVAAAMGTLQIGWLDPISLTIRSIGLSLLPALRYLVLTLLDALYELRIPFLWLPADYLARALRATIFTPEPAYYQIAWVLGGIFLAILLLNRLVPRFFCRAICPLGALLGLLARFSLFGLEKDHEKCDNCNLCLLYCQGAASPQGGVKWRASECTLCLNCQDVCPTNALRFRFFPDLKTSVAPQADLGRRGVVMGVFAGLVFLPLARASSPGEKGSHPRRIRPPGSVEEEEFLSRCLKCGECMKMCPTNALHPAWFEAGVEGVWSPVLIPRLGYCVDSCVLCTQVCPSGAIQPLTEVDKLGEGGKRPLKIGLAFIDRGRCLPWAMATECIVCEEHCPTSPKAIRLEEAVVNRPDGSRLKVRQPYVDPERCWGCGICEYKCPVRSQAAIYVSSVGETRSPENRLLLREATPS